MQHFKWGYPLFILLLKSGIFWLSQVHQYQASYPEWQPISGCHSSACAWALFCWCSLKRKLALKDMWFQTCTTLLQQELSSWGNLARDAGKTFPSQLWQICPSNLSHTASLLFLAGCWLQLKRTYAVIVLCDNFTAPLQHFVQVIQVPCNIHHECKVLHPFCGLKF